MDDTLIPKHHLFSEGEVWLPKKPFQEHIKGAVDEYNLLTSSRALTCECADEDDSCTEPYVIWGWISFCKSR